MMPRVPQSTQVPLESAAIASRDFILVVEDEPVARLSLITLLNNAGYAVEGVGSAEDALRLIAEGQTPRMCIIDVDLPGMSGLDFVRRLVSDLPGVIPILLTAADVDRIGRFRASTPVAYLAKPLEWKKLTALIGPAS